MKHQPATSVASLTRLTKSARKYLSIDRLEVAFAAGRAAVELV